MADNRLVEILATMDVPVRRWAHGAARKHANLRWLMRNLGIRNAGHPDLAEAQQLIRQHMKAGKE
jgi:hypothetical protein